MFNLFQRDCFDLFASSCNLHVELSNVLKNLFIPQTAIDEKRKNRQIELTSLVGYFHPEIFFKLLLKISLRYFELEINRFSSAINLSSFTELL